VEVNGDESWGTVGFGSQESQDTDGRALTATELQ
jgi:hypothetical protein